MSNRQTPLQILDKAKLFIIRGYHYVDRRRMILANRVLVIGLSPAEADELAKVEGNYLFVRVTNLEKIQTPSKKYDALIIDESELKQFSAILGSFDPKKVFIITDKDDVHDLLTIRKPLRALALQEVLDAQLGEIRLPPKGTGELRNGAIVKNKLFPEWGLGIVQEEMENGNFKIKFTNSEKAMKRTEIVCHKSLLRIICSLQEITYENT